MLLRSAAEGTPTAITGIPAERSESPLRGAAAPGSRRYTCVGELNGAVQPPGVVAAEGIHGDDRTGSHLPGGGADQCGGFYSGVQRNVGFYRGEGVALSRLRGQPPGRSARRDGRG